MPIDDALKEMNSAADYNSIMRSYLVALKRFNASFDAEMVSAFTRWMKLNENLETVITPIPQNEMSRLLGRNDPLFKELAAVSDINKLIDKSFNIYNKENHEKISLVTKISQVIDYSQIVMFATLGKIAIIPNLNYLSRFMKEGAKLREYAAEINEEYSSGALATISEIKVTIDPDFSFNTHTLIDFCKYKGKQIAGMIDEVYSLIKTISAAKPADARQYLSKQLHEYHPEFCCKTKQDGPEIPNDINQNLISFETENDTPDDETYLPDFEETEHKSPGDMFGDPDMLGPDDDVPF